MSFPAPGLTPPTLSAWQASYRGLTFGGFTPGAAYCFQGMPQGLDIPAYVTGDQQRALDQGEFAGIDLSPGRDIQYTQAITADNVSFDHARQALGGVMTPGGPTSDPLYLQLPSGCYGCMARPRKHQYVVDNVFIQAGRPGSLSPGTAIAASQWHATDPRWYACPTKTATVGLTPSGSLGGLPFPATFPAMFGGGSYGGQLSVYNLGQMEMRPVLIITGPCTNPVVANLSITGAPWIGVWISLNVGDTLTIDLDFLSVLYTAAGTSVGQSRANQMMAGSQRWNILPSQVGGGLNTILFTTGDAAFVAGTLTVQSADAWLAL